jgi:AmmeMemoRadiSam system protein A
MAATPSTRLDPAARLELLRTAASAIECGLGLVEVAPPDPATLPESLRRARASFVTLTIEGNLRGCCGTLDPARPLALDVWRNAQATAFRDPRFAPLTRTEWLRADLEISVLSPREPMAVSTEAELLGRLVPGRDGLVLSWRGASVTFLPKVWDQLGEPREFVRHLKLKAGWDAGFWSEEIEVWRYDTELMSQSRPAEQPAIPQT